MRIPILVLLILAAVANRAPAGEIVVPSGINAETRPAPGPVLAWLADGSTLLSTGTFGAEQISRLDPDGTLTVFAEGIGSLAGLAVSPSTGAIVVGDSSGGEPLLVLQDLNGDGDALDPGETAPHPATLPVLEGGTPPVPFALSFRPDAVPEELFITASSPGVVLRVIADRATVYADGLQFPAGMVWDGEQLYVANSDLDPFFNFTGRVMIYTDADGDGDALDAVDGDGRSDAVEPAWASSLGSFSTDLQLAEGPTGLVPGVEGDGELWVTLFQEDFSLLAGNVILRSAPHATTRLHDPLAADTLVELAVHGEPGAGALMVLSLDDQGATLFGIGDLGAGFAAPYLILSLGRIGPHGSATTLVPLHGVGAAAGATVVIQGVTLQAGEVGLGNVLAPVLAP
jgi:hypothetical protein